MSRWTDRRGECARKLIVAVLLLAAGGCAARGGSGVVTPESRLRAALASERRAVPVVDSLALELGAGLDHLLSALAQDAATPEITRAHALILLGERLAKSELSAFRHALSAEPVRVRAAAARGLGRLLSVDSTVVPLLARALEDPAPAVQAAALESLGDDRPELMRRYLAGSPEPAVAAVARDLLRVAEQRGAPLAYDSATGELRREVGEGLSLVFRPVRRWPQWDAAVGELVVERAGAAPVVVAREVEAVGGVVPAFVSAGGTHLVYESGRQIRVRDLATGADREVGPGIAPRLLPFSDSFIFLRAAREPLPIGSRFRLVYEVLRADFAGGEPEPLGVMGAFAEWKVKGNYSPVRWMRVVERDGSFHLAGPGVDTFTLPDPFTAGR